ncbi:SprT-like domain-containing protein [Lawsonella clevelandensis]|uniref:SprT-like domain-containing protein n=1 Tax=Lawsonella clevelandensis TaxID=1528099 RepID=UPI0032D951F3
MRDTSPFSNIPGRSHRWDGDDVCAEKSAEKMAHPAEPIFPPQVEIRRSSRRRKTIAGRIEGDRVIVMVPARLSAQAEERAVASMVEKLRKQQRRKHARQTMDGAELFAYVHQLDKRYCGGKAKPAAVEWSRDVTSRWGSCNYRTRTIRLHPVLVTMPRYVLDYVIVHELCHLTVPGGHTEAFWQAVATYPKTERARGYLEAASRYELH